MHPTLNPVARTFIRGCALLGLGAALFAALPSAQAEDSMSLTALADKAALPVTTAIVKDATSKADGPYVLTVTSTAKDSIKLHVKIESSVVVHNRPKERKLPAYDLAAGASWKIDDLAAGDVVSIKAKGFEPLEVTVK